MKRWLCKTAMGMALAVLPTIVWSADNGPLPRRSVFQWSNPLPFGYEALGKVQKELRDPCIVREGDTYYLGETQV